MKRKIRRRLAAEKRKIEKRLGDAVRVNGSGRPVLAGGNAHYELAQRTKAIAHGGIGVIDRLLKKLGLADAINERVKLLQSKRPYWESDHVFNIAYNVLCGGRTLEDIELRRTDAAFLDALGAPSIPDPTTAGDFCRRFDRDSLDALMDAFNATRRKVWRRQSPRFIEQTARIDADGTMVPTTGECKAGMDVSYNGVWGYHPLLVSLANTGEPLFIVNRSGNRPSHEGAAPYLDKAVALCREAGFADVLLRGDTDFSLTAEFDRWTEDGVRFVFGFDANAKAKAWAESAPEEFYQELVRRTEAALDIKPRRRPERVKPRIVKERAFKNYRLKSEQLVDFAYQPKRCDRPYRMVAVRKNISVEKGEQVLFDKIRYFFYVTNDWDITPEEVVHEAHQRCNQENLIEQLKNGVRALRAPVNNLHANWAFMLMAALAWSIKAWVALMLPVHPPCSKRHHAERQQLLRMDFATFRAAFINVPAQILRSGRRLIFRVLNWNQWLHTFFRFAESL